jgi:hypothetical protein
MHSFILTTLTTLAKLCSCMLLLTLRVAAGLVDDLKLNFETRCDFAAVDRDQQLTKLDASYLAALDRQIEKTKATGKLEAVIPLVDEVQAVKAAKDPLPELPQGVSPELKLMRAKHSEARAKILKSHAEALTALAGKMEAALKSQEAELTKAGKIDEAVAVKQMRENLEKDAALAKARNSIAINRNTSQADQWHFLSDAQWSIKESGSYWVGLADASKGKGAYDPNVRKLIEPETKALSQSFLAASPSSISFERERKFTNFKAKVWVPENADLIIKIRIGSTLVHQSSLGGKSPRSAAIEIKFASSSNITIESDPNGTIEHDWLLIESPMVK